MKKNAKLLIIDDEIDVSTLVKNYLEKEGFSVLTATDGKTGIEILQNDDIDLVLLDLALPQMDGNEILKQMKKLNIKVKVILITAYKDAQRIVEAYKNGISDCVFKPFDLKLLKSVINKVLGRNSR